MGLLSDIAGDLLDLVCGGNKQSQNEDGGSVSYPGDNHTPPPTPAK